VAGGLQNQVIDQTVRLVHFRAGSLSADPLDGTRVSTMKRAYVAQNPIEAQLVADELRAAGIEAIVKVDTVAAPSIPFPAVWVQDQDFPRAEQVLLRRTEC
jgi:hypothetical protein